MLIPVKSSGGPTTLAKPRLSFSGTGGSKPWPSPKAVYWASSSAQVIGQVSLPLALRTIDSLGAQRIARITGLGG